MFRDNAVFLDRAARYLLHPPAMLTLGYHPVGRVGRSTRRWRTKAERLERLAWVRRRIAEEWPTWSGR